MDNVAQKSELTKVIIGALVEAICTATSIKAEEVAQKYRALLHMIETDKLDVKLVSREY
jgi:hypothetical protein